MQAVVLDDGTLRDRFIVCRNPDEATRDALIRDPLLAQLAGTIAGSDDATRAAREALACRLRESPGYRGFLRVTKAGLLRIVRAVVAAEATVCGKFLLRNSDPTLSGGGGHRLHALRNPV